MQVSAYNSETRLQRARAAGEILSCFGDCLQFRPKGKPRQDSGRSLIDIWLRGDHAPKPSPYPGEVFNALAEGLACVLCDEGSAEVVDMRREAIQKMLLDV